MLRAEAAGETFAKSDALAEKTCGYCGLSRPLTDFDIRGDTGRRRSFCGACRREYQRKRYALGHPPTARPAARIRSAPLLRCTKCGLWKPGGEFPVRGPKSDRVHSWCRACFAQYNATRYIALRGSEITRLRRNHKRRVAENRRSIAEVLSQHPCIDCGEDDLTVLEFDHLRDKRMDVSRMVYQGWTWTAIAQEIGKCEVRCANCHRRRTVERRGATKVAVSS